MVHCKVMTEKKGLLLLNLGTPKSPAPEDVGVYLKEFLMDPFVIDIPALFRWILVNILIVPKRKVASGLLYQKIWKDRGSPLLYHTQDLLQKVRARISSDTYAEMCMRYGTPSIREGLEKLRRQGVTSLTVLPLYPQYSLAATESSIEKTKAVLKQMHWSVTPRFVPPFFKEAGFLDAFVSIIRPRWQAEKYDKLLFSFHGLPERQVRKTDPSGQVCVCDARCCLTLNSSNQNCYRAQSYATARALAEKLGLKDDQYLVGFQSRLGTTPWIKPYSDMYYERLPKEGVKKLLVASPSFVADCLETVEEISMRGKEQFLENGGEVLDLVPSLNSNDGWADAVVKIAHV